MVPAKYRRQRAASIVVAIMAALLLINTMGCGSGPERQVSAGGQPVALPDVVNDGPAAMNTCGQLRAEFARQQDGTALRGAFRSTVGAVTAWRIGGRFPEAVPTFLQSRPKDAALFVCFLDMEIAHSPPAGGPSSNRAIWLIDASTGDKWPLIFGYHDTPGIPELPIQPVS